MSETPQAPAAAPTCYRHPGRETWIRCQRCDKPICPDCMVPAAVGHQCPDCVKQGRRETRTGLLPFGGQRSADPRATSVALIALNAAVWLLILATGGSASRWIDRLALLPGSAYRQSSTGEQILVHGVDDGSLWQLITSAFTHVSVLHIGFNMLALYYLGPLIEQVFGRARFLALYLAAALAGSAAVMVFASPHSQTLGASGAIFGLMGALLVVAVKIRGNVSNVLMWLGINLVLTFSVPHVSWQGHLGGLTGGALVAAAFVWAPKGVRAPAQWGAVVLVAVVSVLIAVLRAGALG